MRRRSTALTTLAVSLLLTAVTATPALADDTPTSPAAVASTPTAATPTPAAPADPVDLSLQAVQSGGQVARGQQIDVAFDVIGASPGATLTLTLPAGVTVAKADIENRPVTCSPSAGVAVCTLGAVGGTQLTNVLLGTAATTPIGTRVVVNATVAPVPGPDANPADNTASSAFTVIGNADVTQSQSEKQINVPLGGSAPFTITLHNDGPDPATHPKVRFVVQSNDNPKPDLNGFTGTDPDKVAQVNGAFEWTPRTIAPGATVSLTITVTATSPAVDSALSFSTSYDGVGEICVNAACLSGAPIRTFVPGTAPVTTPASGPILANTGSDDGVLTLLAVGLLVAGGGLSVAGRRRRLG